MRLWEDGLIAVLAAVGLASLLWLLVTALRRPRRYACTTVALVRAGNDAAALEQTVRALRGFPRVLVLDGDALGEEAREVAVLLCRDDPRVTLCTCRALTRTLEDTEGVDDGPCDGFRDDPDGRLPK